jgi:hypothetical protein
MSANDQRRKGDRRSGRDRRAVPRLGAPDRRRADRRGIEAVSTGALVATLALAGSEASAQIYTRRNERGIMEATNAPDESDFRLTYPGKGTLIHSSQWRMRPSYGGEFEADIQAACEKHGVSPELVRAVIQVESDFDHLAVSSKGAQGLMQLMPETARRMGVWNSFDARQNIFGGVRHLRLLLDMFQGDTRLACAAYNAGSNAVLRYGGVPPFKETRNYVQRIHTLLSSIGASLQASFFAPNPRALDGTSEDRPAAAAVPAPRPAATARAGARARKPEPRVYYRWRDTQGVLHVGQTPPPDGTAFTLIRALD